MNIVRTDRENPDFTKLVTALNAELSERDGADHAFFAQFSHTETIAHVLIGYIDENPVCCGALRPYDSHRMEVKRMYTVKTHRGRGIAGRILNALEQWSSELGYSHCILETGLNQPEAIRLYEKSGYQLIANYPPYEESRLSRCFEKAV